MDISRLKWLVERGELCNNEQFVLGLTLMFANAVMFNSSGHEVNKQAKDMARQVLVEVKVSNNAWIVEYRVVRNWVTSFKLEYLEPE